MADLPLMPLPNDEEESKTEKENFSKPESEMSVELSSLLPGAFLTVKREEQNLGEIQIEVTGP